MDELEHRSRRIDFIPARIPRQRKTTNCGISEGEQREEGENLISAAEFASDLTKFWHIYSLNQLAVVDGCFERVQQSLNSALFRKVNQLRSDQLGEDLEPPISTGD